MSTKLIGNCKTGLLFVVSAPAGTGKTTLVNMLVNEFPDAVEESISYTTRKCRFGEIPGVHYHFVTEEEFQDKIAKHDFLEYAQIYGCYYGTGYQKILEQQKKGKHVVLVIDTQGALQIKQKYPAILIFLKPPSIEVLRQRLTQRKTESEDLIEVRLAWAKNEIEKACEYDYCIINDDLKVAYQALRSILIAEEHKLTKGRQNGK
jgi:guanylate kinase